MSLSRSPYIGRFAPTPSGPLHFGSIVAALGSYLDAKAHGGSWLLRIDDLDTPRVREGASEQICRALTSLGLHWDGEIIYQSQRQDAYHAAVRSLQERDLLFPCTCSRKQLGTLAYPGTCRERKTAEGQQHALRVRCDENTYGLVDRVQGDYHQHLAGTVGDFVVRRADGLFAYHLAVVVDDAYQGINHIVRGADLLESTPRQVYLQQLLGLPEPIYAHLPLATKSGGEKISKQEKAEDVLIQQRPVAILLACLRFLGQTPPARLARNSVEEVLQWAIANWQLNKVPRTPSMPAPATFDSDKA